jgi:hypothetical protein
VSVPSDRARFRDLDCLACFLVNGSLLVVCSSPERPSVDRISSLALLDADSEGEWSESELVSERWRDGCSWISGLWRGLRFPDVFGEGNCEVFPPLERRRAVVFLDPDL